MSKFLLIFALIAANTANALSTDEILRDFSTDDAITRATKAYQYCDDLFKSWPAPAYPAAVTQLGQAWTTQPESSYYVLNTCQTIWLSRYLDPQKTLLTVNAQDHARFAYYLATTDVLDLPQSLREEIRIHSEIAPASDPKFPPAPYEILTGMASSDRDVDETVHTKMRQNLSILAGSAGLTVGLKVAKYVAGQWAERAGLAARFSKAAIIGVFLAGAAYEATDTVLWYKRKSTLWSDLHQATIKLNQAEASTPVPALLNEFYRATERLGYFYSYGLYLDESGASDQSATANNECGPQIRAYFAGPAGAKLPNTDFINSKVCGDAVSLWIAASQFISQRFPSNPAALIVSDRLMSRAKRTYMSYEESNAYDAAQPVCTPVFYGSDVSLQCRDRLTGAQVL